MNYLELAPYRRFAFPSRSSLLAMLKAQTRAWDRYQSCLEFRADTGTVIHVNVFREHSGEAKVVCVSNGTEDPWTLEYQSPEDALPLVLAQVHLELERRIAGEQRILRVLSDKLSEGLITGLGVQKIEGVVEEDTD